MKSNNHSKDCNFTRIHRPLQPNFTETTQIKQRKKKEDTSNPQNEKNNHSKDWNFTRIHQPLEPNFTKTPQICRQNPTTKQQTAPQTKSDKHLNSSSKPRSTPAAPSSKHQKKPAKRQHNQIQHPTNYPKVGSTKSPPQNQIRLKPRNPIHAKSCKQVTKDSQKTNPRSTPSHLRPTPSAVSKPSSKRKRNEPFPWQRE